MNVNIKQTNLLMNFTHLILVKFYLNPPNVKQNSLDKLNQKLYHISFLEKTELVRKTKVLLLNHGLM